MPTEPEVIARREDMAGKLGYLLYHDDKYWTPDDGSGECDLVTLPTLYELGRDLLAAYDKLQAGDSDAEG